MLLLSIGLLAALLAADLATTGSGVVLAAFALLVTVAGAGALAAWTTVLRRRATEAARREQLLNRVGDLLGDVTGDPDGALGRVAEIAVPGLADWCAIDLLEDDGTIRRAGVAHVDPARRAVAEELGRRWPARPDDPEGAGLTIRTGASQAFTHIPPVDRWPAGTRDPEHLRLLDELGMGSGMVVPLTARGRTLGAITLLAGEGGRRYDGADLALAEEVGRRCALAIDNLRLLAESQAASRRLEESFALLDTLFGSAPIGLGFLDLQGRFVRVNDRLAEINGVPAAAHVGRTVDELVPHLDLSADDSVRRVIETGRAVIEEDVTGETPGAPGLRREWLASYYPVWRGEQMLGVGIVVLEVTDRRAADRALRAQTDRYETLLLALSEVGEGMVVLEGDLLIYANPAFEELSGYPLDELRAMASVWGLVPDWHRSEAQRRAELRAREGMVDPHYELVIEHRSGRLVDLDVAAAPLIVDDREQLVVVVRDITSRKRAEAEREQALALERQAREAAEAAEARMALLARASAVFDSSLEERETLERIARLTVEEVADTCTILLAHPDRPARQAISVARDPRREAQLAALEGHWPESMTPQRTVAAVRRAGRASLLRHLGRRLGEGGAPEHAEAFRRLGLSATALVPLKAGGRTFGALSCGLADPPSPDHERETLSLLDELGQRASLAIENARLYAERTAVARTLQRSLLPAGLPAIRGVELAARYRPAREGNEGGGDFYDCFATGDGEYALVIGDVCGKGVEAAAVTALARHTMRASVLHGQDPVGVLAELNEALLRQELDLRFCTVLYVGLRRAAGGWEASIASGGHPLPLVLRADGSVAQAGRTGTLLGVVPDPDLRADRLLLVPGDTLVAYTDGVIEASPLDDAFGPRAFAGFLGGQAGRPAEEVATAIEQEVLALQTGRLRDDVALVVLRVASGT